MGTYITGDTHGSFKGLLKWIKTNNINENDTVIILGDHGINFYLSWKDKDTKKKLAKTGVNLFLVRGNHDRRPDDVYNGRWTSDAYKGEYPIPRGYKDTYFNNTVWVEKDFPNIKHAIDGLIYNIEGKNCLVIGGGYSVDKYYRLQNGRTWIDNEQLDSGEMYDIMETYIKNQVDIILSHVAPSAWNKHISYLWMSNTWGIIETAMEDWMNSFLWHNKTDKLDRWYFAHNHANINVPPFGTMLYDMVIPFGTKAQDGYTPENDRRD